MIIAQITDLHIDRTDASGANDARLETVIARLNEIAPDLIVATGDLAGDGAPASYERLKELLMAVKAPILPVMGNHDRRDAFIDAFGSELVNDGVVQYATQAGDLRVIVIDTADAGRHSGAFCERRAAWLAACLDDQPEAPTLVALHHPPVRSGIAWMDEDSDGAWSRRLAEVLTGRSQIIGLVAGHLHRPMVTTFAGHPLIVAPSCAPQVFLDLGPKDGNGTARLLPRIVAEQPGFAVHIWNGADLLSHFVAAGDTRVIASFDTISGQMVSG